MSTESKLNMTVSYAVQKWSVRRWLYPALLALIVGSWFVYMTVSNSWHLFQTYWPISLTMLFGSFVAGATPQGGAAVAFPVFTKVLRIPAADSRNFGFMIQAVGMTMAGVLIWAKRIKVLPGVILWVTLGGFVGTTLGTFWLVLPNPYPRILFTLGATAFGVALFSSHGVLNCPPQQELPDWNGRYLLLFTGIGLLGGIFSAQTGSGADMLTFIVLTLAFGIHEKISTPTTVIIMGLNSIFGFFLHGVVVQDLGVAWNYWLVAVPIVVFGAPLGAYFTSRISRDVLITFILILIAVEMITTAILIPFTALIFVVVGLVVTLCTFCFVSMLFYRQRTIAATAIG